MSCRMQAQRGARRGDRVGRQRSRVKQPACAAAASRSPCLILPAFLSSSADAAYRDMAATLEARGHAKAVVLPVSLADWAGVLAGGSFTWYLQRIAELAEELSGSQGDRQQGLWQEQQRAAAGADAQRGAGDGQAAAGASAGGAAAVALQAQPGRAAPAEAAPGRGLTLVGVSAGGWLARLALGGRPYDGRVYGLAPRVRCLVTLGSPHGSLEAYPFGRVQERRQGEEPGLLPDVQGSSLRLANHYYPTAASLAPTRLVCVRSATIRGAASWQEAQAQARSGAAGSGGGGGAVPAALAQLGAAWDAFFAGSSYAANCGRADMVGDGVCPLECAAVPGAEVIEMRGVWHSPGRGKVWYGSRQAVEQWDAALP